MKKTKEMAKLGFFILVTAILFSSFVSAFAISSPYWKESPLKLMPGDSRDVQFVIVNQAGDSDLKVRVNILEGNASIRITDSSNTYDCPLGSKTPVNFKVNVAQNAKIGETREIKLEFTTIVASESGSFGISNSIEKSFPLIIGTEASLTLEPMTAAKSSSLIWLYILIAIVVLIIIIVIVSKTKKRK